MIGLALLALATALLTGGAELFAENATAAARRLGISVLAIGLLLAGAEPEELVTGAIASYRHHPALAMGDVFGANITMLTLTLGLAALARPLPLSRRVRLYAVGSAVAGVLAFAAITGGGVGRPGGALLVVAYAALVGFIWWRERVPPAIGELAEIEEASMTSPRAVTSLPVARVLAGVALMAVGGDLAVDGATRLVTALGVEDRAVGLTFLAFATTAELFALVWAAARRGATELAVAGVVGSAAYNATATLGVAALVRPLHTGDFRGPAALAAALPLVIVLAGRRGRLGRAPAVALIVGYVIFVVIVLR